MKLSKIALAVATLAVASSALAHGYIESPASRAYMCKLGQNIDCGSVQYEPQSVERTSGFPTGAMPPDGQLASAGIASYSQLDKQSLNAWTKSPMTAGPHEFVWHHTAPHKTTNWRYYITKQNWDPNKPLTRDQFELTPFCTINGNGQAPSMTKSMTCNVPERTGYQVIYGVWEIADTANSFYQAIDVDFGNGGNVTPDDTPAVISQWSKTLSGQIAGNNLNVGDKVIARFFDANGEVAALRTEMTIGSSEQGDANQWSYDLAQKINTTHSDVRVGVKDEAGEISPVHGANSVFVKDGSTLKSVAISYEEQKAQVSETIAVSDLQYSKIEHGNVIVTFHVNTQGDVNFEAHVMNHHGAEKGYLKQDMNNVNQNVTMTLTDVTAGHHMLKYYATNKDGTLFAQDVLNLMLESDAADSSGPHDFIFPDSIASYKAGTVVLQPKNGKTYECKPFPYSGYCVQWSKYATQFEPGVGAHWREAWVLKN
ncbi:TPA: N-acetylglucosamine-binding protein GbpA [Enterobacter hormaechei]|uniref:N-acetylglucosamine-binding protein GbpA n=1 Tax=Enterobacter hormaechei TaxID=158836 RepID=UPI001FF2A3B9|nr:N-acetylglucosamine-binding protein GbpA [Enterobacter hormaechei]MCJ8525280.1 N-acetylglucosamine-binding protein GbpA [Enterobacter hormaechei]MEB6553219.1 N-acetylglucosamine-binding protein GbpA [Enterobacter hormaechei]HEM7461847.1 N-acetylglucosamine-binding protein GbpA [Enterobacter hormaechei]